MISLDPRTQEIELQVQKIINLYNVANNLPDAFTDYNGIIKFWNLIDNAPESVEVPNKTTSAPSTKKRGGQKLLERIPLQKNERERRNQKLLENSKIWFNEKLNNTIRMQMIRSLVLKRAIQMRLERQKFPTTSYWEIMMRQRE
jgi:hypothetical protein